MWYRIVQYLKYLYYSKSIYRIHSPFVYDLIAHVLESTTIEDEYKYITNYRTTLKESQKTIDFDGFGADKSKKTHTLNYIVKYISIPHKKGIWYSKIIEKYQYKNVVELGTCIGIGTLYLSKNPNVFTYTFEANSGCINHSKELFTQFSLNNIELVEGNIDDTAPLFVSNKSNIDLLVIDANHTYEATIKYFDIFEASLTDNAVVIIDDIYWSEGMTKAWNQLKSHPKVTLSLDFYRCGMLFFQHNRLEKEHFKVWVND